MKKRGKKTVQKIVLRNRGFIANGGSTIDNCSQFLIKILPIFLAIYGLARFICLFEAI